MGGEEEKGDIRFTGKIELGVICLMVGENLLYFVSTEEGVKVNDEEKDRALGHTCGNEGSLECERFTLN